MSRELTGAPRARIAEILETVAREGLGPRDMDWALDAIGCAIYDDEDSRSASPPPGYRLVPEEPTQEMMQAFEDAYAIHEGCVPPNPWTLADYFYRAMLSAAPSSPSAWQGDA